MYRNPSAIVFGILSMLAIIFSFAAYVEWKKETPSLTLKKTWLIIFSLIVTLGIIFFCTFLSSGFGVPIVSSLTGMRLEVRV